MSAEMLPLDCPLPSWQQVQVWWHEATSPDYGCLPQHIELAHAAARWAAEEQLTQCCQWAQEHHGAGTELRAFCREETPQASLREQAQAALERLVRPSGDVVQEAADIALLHNLLAGMLDD